MPFEVQRNVPLSSTQKTTAWIICVYPAVVCALNMSSLGSFTTTPTTDFLTLLLDVGVTAAAAHITYQLRRKYPVIVAYTVLLWGYGIVLALGVALVIASWF